MRFAAAVLLMAAGCGTDYPATPETLSQLCSGIGEAACLRAEECDDGEGATHDDCVAAFVGACCAEDGTCATALRTIEEDAWHDCYDDYETLACEDLLDGVIPSKCLSM